MKKIKVLYVINSSSCDGSNKALLNMLGGMVDKGIVPMVIMAAKGKMCNELELRSINYQTIRHYFSIYPPLRSLRDFLLFLPRLFRTVWINYHAVKKLTRLVNEFKPDVIHTNVGPLHIGFQVAKKLNIPHVWHIREYQDLYFGWHPFPSKRNFIRKLLFANNYPVVITQGMFDHYHLKGNARVICDGVMEKYQIRFCAGKKKYFLFVGQLTGAKGIRLLIEAYLDFCKHDTDFELLIAGDDVSPYAKGLHRIVDDAQCNRRVRFLGFRTDISDLMANASALVVPSRCEGFGFVTVEAMFNGCLVIGNNSGGTKEILEKEDLGILYSGHDELVAAMKAVVSNGIESYYPMIKKAQARAVALYSIEQNVAAVHGLYQEILAKQTI